MHEKLTSYFIVQFFAFFATKLRTLALIIALLATAPAALANEFSNITTARLAGQMVLIGVPGKSKNDYLVKKLSQEASLGKLGGVVFSASNFTDLPTTSALIERFSNIAVANPLLIALDPRSINSQFRQLSALDANTANLPMRKARLGYLKGSLEVFRLGFNTIFAPDLSPKELSSAEPDTASARYGDIHRQSLYAQLAAETMLEAGLVRAASTFPGELASHPKKQSEYYLEWLRPFYDAIISQNAEIMVLSNKIFPSLDPLRPAAQSPKIHRILREQLGFKGLVATADILGGDLDSQEFSERIIASINAGCDLLFFANSTIKHGDTASNVVSIITKAVERGQISRARIEESYKRIITLKSHLREHIHEEQ